MTDNAAKLVGSLTGRFGDKSDFPKIEDVDISNELCYGALASEYDSEVHATCRNFDTFTERFLSSVCGLFSLNDHFRYLDVGAGTGKSLSTLRGYLEAHSAEVEVVDISLKMLDRTRRKVGALVYKYHHVSIHKFENALPYRMIVATMSDPFLTPQALTIMAKVLDNDGYLVLTSPLPIWAAQTREAGARERSVFRDLEGKIHSAFSFCWAPASLARFLRNSNLELKAFVSESLLELASFASVSPIHQKLLSENADIPYCAGYVFRKSADREP